MKESVYIQTAQITRTHSPQRPNARDATINVMAVRAPPPTVWTALLPIYSSRRLTPVSLLVLINSMIIITFPFARVHNIYIYIYIYIDCPTHCMHCKRIELTPPNPPNDPSPENFNCLFCMVNYFLNSEAICVPGGDCGEGNYPEQESRTCEPCNEACHGCVGPLNSDCILCDEKYTMSSKLVCEEIVCQSDEYLEDKTFVCKSMCWLYIYIYIFIYIYIYIECNSRCQGCIGPSEFECKACSPGYLMNTTILQCQTCEQYDTAYLNPPPGKLDCLGK